MPIQGVIFDLFHTLTGRESAWSSVPWTSDMLGVDRTRWEEVLWTRSHWRLTGEERDPYRILRALALEADPTIPDERIREALTVRQHRFRDTLLGVPPENLTALRDLRAAQLRLGLITNADAIEVADWADSPLCGMFDAEVFSCKVGCIKPERAIYEHCLRALELPPEECLYVGDGGSDELAGARAIGMPTVFVSGVIADLWPDCIPGRRAQADHHVESVPEVLAILGLLR